MIRFQRDGGGLPTILAGLGAVVFAATLLYLIFVPAPTTKGLVKRTRERERLIAVKMSDAKKLRAEQEALLARRKSALPPDAIGPEALSRITAFAQANRLRLVGFRPQRTVTMAAGLIQYPYQVALEGPFPAVVKLVRMVEERTNDIAVTSLQAASSDGESDRVSATVGIAIFRDPPAKPRGSTGTSGPRMGAGMSGETRG